MASLVERARLMALATLADLPSRRAHVAGVAAAAERVAHRLGLEDSDVLVAAAWLHDVGYAERAAVTGFHPVDGAVWLRDQGFSGAVVSLVAYHTGAEVEAAERGLSDVLERFGRPDPIMLDLLTFSDLTVGPEGGLVDALDRIEEILSRYPEGHPVHRAVSRSAPELMACVDRVSRMGLEGRPGHGA